MVIVFSGCQAQMGERQMGPDDDMKSVQLQMT